MSRGQGHPKEVWNGERWLPYKGEVPKRIEWGSEVSEEEAKAYGYKADAAAAEQALKEKVGAAA